MNNPKTELSPNEETKRRHPFIYGILIGIFGSSTLIATMLQISIGFENLNRIPINKRKSESINNNICENSSILLCTGTDKKWTNKIDLNKRKWERTSSTKGGNMFGIVEGITCPDNQIYYLTLSDNGNRNYCYGKTTSTSASGKCSNEELFTCDFLNN